MNTYLEANFVPNEQQQQVIDTILGNDFPWYITDSTGDKKHAVFTHCLMQRANNFEEKERIINSSFYETIKNIMVGICTENKIEVNTIFRLTINNSYHYPEKFGVIHTDHDFDHKQLIWYINSFTDAPTYLFDDEDNLIKTTDVGKNKIAIFDKVRHAQGFCAPYENRIVAVFTFN